MNSKQRKTLNKIMATPALTSIEFDAVVKCMQAMGYRFEQREGSRIAFIIKDEELPMHKPHPAKEIKQYTVRELQKFIKRTQDLL